MAVAKRHFVLDENVVILAYKGQDPHGQSDATCLQLIRAIEGNCHSLVLSWEIWRQYSKQADRLMGLISLKKTRS